MLAMNQTPLLQPALAGNTLPIPSALGSLEAYIGAVNAIPAVVAAAPGICTTIDLPLITGKGLYAAG